MQSRHITGTDWYPGALPTRRAGRPFCKAAEASGVGQALGKNPHHLLGEGQPQQLCCPEEPSIGLKLLLSRRGCRSAWLTSAHESCNGTSSQLLAGRTRTTLGLLQLVRPGTGRTAPYIVHVALMGRMSTPWPTSRSKDGLHELAFMSMVVRTMPVSRGPSCS